MAKEFWSWFRLAPFEAQLQLALLTRTLVPAPRLPVLSGNRASKTTWRQGHQPNLPRANPLTMLRAARTEGMTRASRRQLTRRLKSRLSKRLRFNTIQAQAFLSLRT